MSGRDIAAFIRARLDEDEAAAKGPPGWKVEHWSAVRYKSAASGREWRVDAEPRCIVDQVIGEDARFIARHDPARALREVAAGRALLAQAAASDYMDSDDYSNEQRVEAEVNGLGILRALASIWSDHPDYQQEWAVGYGCP